MLQQLQSLPTLSAIATRLLQLTSDDRADIREVVEMIESDPALTLKVLGLCRRADRGVTGSATTVDRAVVLLGFDAIRNAVLSLEFIHLLSEEESDEVDENESDGVSARRRASTGARRFDRIGFWKHSISVAVACHLIAEAQGPNRPFQPSEAFVCGLLHDVGKLALDWLLPKSYDRVVELANLQMANIAEMERRVIGVDHHTVGKRLAEKWSLPHAMQDVMWLHGQPYESLPELPHRPMIALVSLADGFVRQQHIGYSGNHQIPRDLNALCEAIDVDPKALAEITPRLHQETQERAELLGLEDAPSWNLLLESVSRANQALGRINHALDHRSQMAVRQERVLRAISEFHELESAGQSVVSTCGRVVASAAGEFGRGFYAMLCPTRNQTQWQVLQFHSDGRLKRSQIVEPPAGMHSIEELGEEMQISVGMLALLPWLSEYLTDCDDIRQVRLLPLRCWRGLASIMLHDRNLHDLGLTRTELMALCETWAAAIAAAGQHEGAKRLGEQLAESNRILTETQARLARSQMMASLGEMAAGAAHEMNNPLCVISGRSQVLAMQLDEPKYRTMAQQIVDQAHRLSDLITSLHLFADPPAPRPHDVDLPQMIERIVAAAQERRPCDTPIRILTPGDLPIAYLDDEQIGQALLELIVNAIEASPRESIEVQAEIDSTDDRLVLRVRDDGVGMSRHTLAHAFDPFFSEKPAGRQPGLGLARAQRLVAMHGGEIELDSTPGKGASATIHLGRWRRLDGLGNRGRTNDKDENDVVDHRAA